LSGGVDETIDVDGLHEFHARLPAAMAVNLHGRGPLSHRVLLAQRPLSFLAFAHPDIEESAGMPEWRRHEHEVVRWCRLCSESGIPANPADLDLDPVALRTRAPRRAQGATLIHPGAGSESRRWPPERFAEIARIERRRGRAVVLTGAVGDLARCDYIAREAALPVDSVYAGRTNVVELAALVAAADRVLCGDTGVGHLATALGRPSVLLFGPAAPSEWGPPPSRPQHRVLWAGRSGDPHANAVDAGLMAITMHAVVDALDAVDGISNASAPFAQRTAG
jgi:ADP-heptose:LPS heptosyltransferase